MNLSQINALESDSSDQPLANPSSETAPTATPLPSPPFITTIPSIPNLRSIGGLHTRRPGFITRGHIYRSGDPSRLAASSHAEFQQVLAIRTIFDLRSRGELEGHTLAPLDGVDNRFTPVYENKDVSPAELAKTIAAYGTSTGTDGFVDSYCRILDAGCNAYRAFFRHLLERRDDAVLVHCTAGKDRTGVAIALVLKIAGVEDGDIADEYALTDLGLREWKEGVVRMLMGSRALGADEGMVRRMLGSRREVMIAFLQVLEQKYGGAEGYLMDRLGFTEEEIETIRNNLVEKAE